MSKQEQKKINIINKTIELCSKYGFHGTSMDNITSATSVSKATIYKYFNSKENLIAEALAIFSQQAIEKLELLYSDNTLTLEQKLSSRFDGLLDLFNRHAFHGCYFQLAYSEFNQIDPNIGQICSGYKQKRLTMLDELLQNEGIKDPTYKAKQAELIFNGLLATLQITEDQSLIPIAKDMYLTAILKS
ncbi:TetR/AcrR family transcriptional regulator [Photobacterium leiognathi]|uniref:TetR/AcrR family transcriptional regulator n=1 Tax=Photobacterium leiognathi TaxID=553611 RepID=UPI0027365164|nr:TetR family transcriptional regulator [Photobacterium leiognathi]